MLQSGTSCPTISHPVTPICINALFPASPNNEEPHSITSAYTTTRTATDPWCKCTLKLHNQHSTERAPACCRRPTAVAVTGTLSPCGHVHLLRVKYILTIRHKTHATGQAQTLLSEPLCDPATEAGREGTLSPATDDGREPLSLEAFLVGRGTAATCGTAERSWPEWAVAADDQGIPAAPPEACLTIGLAIESLPEGRTSKETHHTSGIPSCVNMLHGKGAHGPRMHCFW